MNTRNFAILVSVLLATASSGISVQAALTADPKSSKECRLRRMGERHMSKPAEIHVRKGEKATGFSPIIAFEITESGEVQKARVKRSSGIADIDAYALNWIQSAKYNNRPGCGLVTSQASVNIHFRDGVAAVD
jgi:TonB family protein